ncbi:MAG: biotin-dependent carboxyltransferase family protein [Rhodanobacteraceae bacterium]|nr:biotin-dependent carboxyltransferase family protein [Pseudomonadota bacterium]
MTIEVVKSGLSTTPQDLGRVGFAHLGVGRAGAFDVPALRIANALCGNLPDACALEITLLGPTLRFRHDAHIAVAGAPLPVHLAGVEQAMWSPLRVCAGQTLVLGAMRGGCRTYLAVRGGFDFEPVLGSRGLDVNAAIGPLDGRALRAGDAVKIGRTGAGGQGANKYRNDQGKALQNWSVDPRPWFDGEPRHPLHLLPGRHFDKLDATSHEALFAQSFQVANDSNRVGVRLEGPRLALSEPIETISEGCVAGTLQLPPSGHPIALGVEHPVSGGYPRIGQIIAVDLPHLAQRRPGDRLRFAPRTLDEALRLYAERERQLGNLEAAIAKRLAHDA